MCTPQFAKTYLIIHLIPFLLFKRKQLRKAPLKCVLKFLKGYFKSMFFIMWYCYWGTRSLCMIRNVSPKLSRKQFYDDIFPYPLAIFVFLFSAFSASGVCIEAPGRRLEIGQYVFPKVLEGNVQFFRKRHWIPKRIPFGAVSLTLRYRCLTSIVCMVRHRYGYH